MKAALLTRPGEVKIQEVEGPKVGPLEALIKIKSCGVCATDVKKYVGASKAPWLPFILGHEPAGVVVEVGQDVEDELSLGSRVAVAPVFTCGHCYGCRSGLTYSQGMGMCEDYEVLGYSMNGAFAEYVAVPARHVHLIPDELSFRDAALIEPVAACINGALRVSQTPPGTVVVIGCGFMGLATVQLLKLLGNRVVASDLQEERRQLALDLGADAVLDPGKEEIVSRVLELTDGRGADGVLCAVGGKAVTEQAMDLLAKGGRLVLLASAPAGTKFEVDLSRLHYSQAVLTGSVSYTGPGYEWSSQLLRRGSLDVDTLISAVGPLEQTGEFLKMTKNLKGLKKVVMIGE